MTPNPKARPDDREKRAHVWIERYHDGMLHCGDEDGDFAAAETIDSLVPYLRDLVEGPGTIHRPGPLPAIEPRQWPFDFDSTIPDKEFFGPAPTETPARRVGPDGRILSIEIQDGAYLIVNEDEPGKQSAVLYPDEMAWLLNTVPKLDHPAGCFYGSFGGYKDNWHIPHGADCPLDHGDKPIRLEAPK